MKKILLIMTCILFAVSISAQTEYFYDFNNLTEGQKNLSGQDHWSTHFQTASTSPDFDVATIDDGVMSPDETVGIFYPYGGSGVGRTATRKASDNFNFNFKDGGIMDLEIDMFRNWWGVFFGVGYDANGDGNILPGVTDGDGGVYLYVKNQGTNTSTLHLPNGTVINLGYDTTKWTRYRISFDFTANDGAGSVTVFVKPHCIGEWLQLASCTNVNMGLTPGSGDKNDYHTWDGVFFHSQGGTGGFDNLLVRKQPEGNVQYIEMSDIPKQLTINPPITLHATATSGLDVSYALVSGPATINGNVLTLTGQVGTVTIVASQAGNDQWLPAPNVYKTFEVIDPMAYTPDITIRRPYNNANVYMPELKTMLLVVSSYIENNDVLKMEHVSCTIDDEDIELHTFYPDDPENGYYSATWTPTRYGSYDMTVTVTTTGGKVTTSTCTFNVSNEYETMNVVTMHGDLVCTPSVTSAKGQYEIPCHVGAFNAINAVYDHNCVNHNCDIYDRVGGVRVRNYRGEWIELFRYLSPFGVECEDAVDVSDYTSVLQGLVEFEFYFETYNGSGYSPTLTLNFEKGTPEYLYADVDEIWSAIYAFGDYSNQFPVPVVNYQFSNKVIKATLKMTTTGHNWSSNTAPNYSVNTGNAAEFYEATHNIVINGQQKYTQHLWQTCTPNPSGCQPQNGTWYYNRAGWCPGSIGMVWNWDLSEYVASGSAELFYQFDPTYIDMCHPNYPNCKDGQNGCPNCDAPDNPILNVAAKVICFSNNSGMFEGIKPITLPACSFNVEIYPNPANNVVKFTSDYTQSMTSVIIINMEGNAVRKFAFKGEREINISDLPAGIYIVKILGDTMITKKLVVK